METILITGVNKGIGNALVEHALLLNHHVIALGRRTSNFEGIKGVDYYQVDLENEKEIIQFAKSLKKKNIQLTALINNAGALINKPFAQTSFNDFEKIFRVNVFGLASLIRETLAFFKANSQIVNISSVGGVQGSSKFAGLSAYSSSKGAVNILTELLAEEFKELNISVNALALGAVQTEMLAEAFPGFKAPISAKEIAPFIIDFALKNHAFMNGKIIPVSTSTP